MVSGEKNQRKSNQQLNIGDEPWEFVQVGRDRFKLPEAEQNKQKLFRRPIQFETFESGRQSFKQDRAGLFRQSHQFDWATAEQQSAEEHRSKFV